jgi:hypothetical protein
VVLTTDTNVPASFYRWNKIAHTFGSGFDVSFVSCFAPFMAFSEGVENIKIDTKRALGVNHAKQKHPSSESDKINKE